MSDVIITLFKAAIVVCVEVLLLFAFIFVGCWIFEVPMITQRQFWGCFYILSVWKYYHYSSTKNAVGKVFG